ncbi:MAG: ERF family protein [Lachnospiraceae bacterium]
MTILEKLQKIQMELKAPKNLYNKFGQYYYRNAESILETFKPLEDKYKVCLILRDEIVVIADRFYVKSTAELFDMESKTVASLESSAYAREDLSKKGMDGSQITGSTSSYARKYALNGLFLLDDTKDSDTDEGRKEAKSREETKLTQKEIEHLRQIIERRGFTEKTFCEKYDNYNLSSLNDVSRNQYNWIMEKWGGESNE